MMTETATTDAGSSGTAAAPADLDPSLEQQPDIELTPPPMDPGFAEDTPAEPADAAEQIMLKVNGKELSLPLPEVIAAAQRDLAAAGRLEQVKKQAAEIKSQQAHIDTQKGAIQQLVK